MDCRDPGVLVTLLLAAVLHRNPDTGVIFASTVASRLGSALAAIEISQSSRVAWFAARLDEHRMTILGEGA
jgi:hypothetical protein